MTDPTASTGSPSTDADRVARQLANRGLLRAFEAMWDAYPEMRFGQLVMNLSRTPTGFADTWEWSNSRWRERIEETWKQYRKAGYGN